MSLSTMAVNSAEIRIGAIAAGLGACWLFRERLKRPVLIVAAVGLAYVAFKTVHNNTAIGAAADTAPVRPGVIPAEYRPWVEKAGHLCPEVGPTLLAAQIEQESGWDPTIVSPAGAVGIAQFMPGTWPSWSKDDDGTNWVNPKNPRDSIMAMGRYDCSMARQVAGIGGDRTANLLAAYNAGLGAVQQAGGVPNYAETRNYVASIKALKGKYTAD